MTLDDEPCRERMFSGAVIRARYKCGECRRRDPGAIQMRWVERHEVLECVVEDRGFSLQIRES